MCSVIKGEKPYFRVTKPLNSHRKGDWLFGLKYSVNIGNIYLNFYWSLIFYYETTATRSSEFRGLN